MDELSRQQQDERRYVNMMVHESHLTAPTYCLYYWPRLTHRRNDQYVLGLETLSITSVLSHHSLVITSLFLCAIRDN